MVITNILELKYLDYLGVSPLLDSCSICGSKTDIVTLSHTSNGLICKSCKTNEKIYDLKTIKYLRMYKYLDVSKITKIDMDKNIIEEINRFLNEYYEHHTGIYLNSKKFIDDLRKIDLYN
jgi:DNA repair protein RecO (recombination protein O)